MNCNFHLRDVSPKNSFYLQQRIFALYRNPPQLPPHMSRVALALIEHGSESEVNTSDIPSLGGVHRSKNSTSMYCELVSHRNFPTSHKHLHLPSFTAVQNCAGICQYSATTLLSQSPRLVSSHRCPMKSEHGKLSCLTANKPGIHHQLVRSTRSVTVHPLFLYLLAASRI